MARLLDDWISTFLDYTDHMEAPRLMRSWAAISAVASVLRRRVWIDQDQFKWTPSLYIIFVGPPGVLTKSTTTDLSSSLLRELPTGLVHFGPNNITWQALATTFTKSSEFYEYPFGSGDQYPMSAITLISREMGSLLNPRDQDLVNLFIELYDGAPLYEKVTKMSGDDKIESPWINMIGATTPSWIADNVPQSALGGGLISRVIFLYGDEKEKFVPYPKSLIRNRTAHATVRKALVHDLEHIALNLLGPYELTPEAEAWGSDWYVKLWKGAKEHYSDDKLMGYIARKQTHMHKVAMILAASHKDKQVITLEELQTANLMLEDVEGALDKVFAQIGRTIQSVQSEKFIEIIRRKGAILYEEAYRLVHTHFPDFRDFEGVCNGAIRSGQLELWANPQDGGKFYLRVPNHRRPLSPDNGPPTASTETDKPNG